LQIYWWICQWKKFENRSTFGEVMDNIVVPCFFDSQCSFSSNFLIAKFWPIFGRPFVKRFALCYRSVVCPGPVCPVCPVCPGCPSVLSVSDVRALWPNSWTDQDENWHAGRPTCMPSFILIRPTIFLFGEGSEVPIWRKVDWPRPTSIPITKWRLDPCSHLAATDMGRKLGGGAGSPSNTMWRGRGLPACQVSPWSVQPFGHSARTSQTDRQNRTDRTTVR